MTEITSIIELYRNKLDDLKEYLREEQKTEDQIYHIVTLFLTENDFQNELNGLDLPNYTKAQKEALLLTIAADFYMFEKFETNCQFYVGVGNELLNKIQTFFTRKEAIMDFFYDPDEMINIEIMICSFFTFRNINSPYYKKQIALFHMQIDKLDFLVHLYKPAYVDYLLALQNIVSDTDTIMSMLTVTYCRLKNQYMQFLETIYNNPKGMYDWVLDNFYDGYGAALEVLEDDTAESDEDNFPGELLNENNEEMDQIEIKSDQDSVSASIGFIPDEIDERTQITELQFEQIRFGIYRLYQKIKLEFLSELISQLSSKQAVYRALGYLFALVYRDLKLEEQKENVPEHEERLIAILEDETKTFDEIIEAFLYQDQEFSFSILETVVLYHIELVDDEKTDEELESPEAIKVYRKFNRFEKGGDNENNRRLH